MINDNDLIKRGDVKDVLESAFYEEASFSELLEKIDGIPTVPQEMSAREYFKQVRRLQNWADQLQQQYRRANETLYKVCDDYVDSAIEEVEKWAREHPERNEEVTQ